MYIQLINSDQKVKLCRTGFSFLKKSKMDKGRRLHSAGYAVLQFTRFGRINTFYMHKLLAEKFIPTESEEGKLFVRMKNADKLDCRIENLDWAGMSELRRQQTSRNGYRGVSRDGKKYRAVLYDGKERIYLGVFATAEEAALAYNAESEKRFGKTRSLNKISSENSPTQS